VPGAVNDARRAYLLADAEQHPLTISRDGDALFVSLPRKAMDAVNSVVVPDIVGPWSGG
jgi:hypothetical protein